MSEGQKKTLPMSETEWNVFLMEIGENEWRWSAYAKYPQLSEVYFLPGIRLYKSISEVRQAWLRFARKNNYIRYRIMENMAK